VVVAAGATERKAEECAAGVLDGVLDGQVRLAFAAAEMACDGQVAGGDGEFRIWGLELRVQQITGELLADEAVERLVTTSSQCRAQRSP